MNAINKENSLSKDIIVLGALGSFFIGIPIGFVIIFGYFDLSYVIPALITFVLFFISTIITFRQKRLNINSIVTFTVGLLFLASSVIEFSFITFAQNMSIRDQIMFSGIMRPNQVSHGLSSIGVGIVILINFRNNKSNAFLIENSLVQNHKGLHIIGFGAGIFLLLLGIYIFINGLHPL